jgi:Calcineurin-like phosphoesterase
MKKFFFACCLLIISFYSARSQSTNLCDGPYVSYVGNQVIVHAINQSGQPTLDSFNIKDKSRHPLTIHFSNHAGWDFNVTLRKKLTNEPSISKGPEKLLAISDIEGEFENFRALLIANGVMDEQYKWTLGKGVLVICGDLFDRGKDVVQELWLLYKLEDDARTHGGYVHTILGNHDIMNMSGDLRYLQNKYFEHAKAMGKDYMDLYDANTELGRWLRSKNIIEKIGDNLCLHGGISPQIYALAWPVTKINSACRPYYDKGEQPDQFKDTILWKFFDGHNISPFWYRGYFLEPQATQGFIDSTLNLYACKRIIVGHTIVDTNVGSYYNNKLIGVDVDEHDGHTEGLLIEKGKCYKVNTTKNKTLL